MQRKKNPTRMYALVFDCETTGLPTRRRGAVSGPPDPAERSNYAGARLVQLAWQLVEMSTGAVITEGSEYIYPSGQDWNMHPMAEKTHGTSRAKLEIKGKDLLDVLMDFLDAAMRSTILVCHNIDFDLNVVVAELLHNAPIASAALYLLEMPRFCTMRASVDLCRLPFPSGRSWGSQSFKWPKLLELHHVLFEEGFDGAHDAIEDVRATVRCFVALDKRQR